MIDGIPAPGPSIFTKRTLLDDEMVINGIVIGIDPVDKIIYVL